MHRLKEGAAMQHHSATPLATDIAQRLLARRTPRREADAAGFDLSLLYAECGGCGRPLVWPAVMTRGILRKAGVDPETLDLGHLLRTDGCHQCSPDRDDFTVTLVKLVG